MAKRKKFNPGGHKGKLHRELGIPEGQKIPQARLKAAAHSSNPTIRRDAIRAETMEKWHHGKRTVTPRAAMHHRQARGR